MAHGSTPSADNSLLARRSCSAPPVWAEHDCPQMTSCAATDPCRRPMLGRWPPSICRGRSAGSGAWPTCRSGSWPRLPASRSRPSAMPRRRRDLRRSASSRAAGLAGLRLALLDDGGREVAAMSADAVRDMGGRRFPAHLDTRYSDEGWWHGAAPVRPGAALVHVRPRPRMRDRVPATARHARRPSAPAAGRLPRRPGRSPAAGVLAARAEERERRFLAGEFAGRPTRSPAPAQPGATSSTTGSGRPVHAAGCPCLCDLG